MNAAPPPPFPRKRYPCPGLRRLLLCLLLLLPLPLPASSNPPAGPDRTVTVDGHPIPIYATADQQLAFARSHVAEHEEKAAAFEAVARLHPAAREAVAMAAMELAYLALGSDYRLAGRDMTMLARDRYLAVLDRYPDLPAVAAKALWHLGWLGCDLMGDPEQGLAWYRQLIARYPMQRLSIVAPAPWISIRSAGPEEGKHPAYPKAVLTWADLARLEIIRHTTDPGEAENSLRALHRAGAGASTLAAEALKALIPRFGVDPESERLVREYLARPDGDPLLKEDLSLALSVARQQADASGGHR